MSKKDNEDNNSQNVEDDESQNLGDDTDDTSSQDDVDDEGNESSTLEFEDTDDPDELKEQLRKQQEHGTRMFERAKKAEGYKKVKDPATGKTIWVKKDGKPAEKKPAANNQPQNNQPQQQSSLSEEDIWAFMDAGVRDKEDREIVKRYAKANDLTISEALGEDVVKTTLANRAENRRTQNASNTDKTRRTPSRQTGESLLGNASRTGELPDDDDAMARLAEERFKPRR